ncbi:MAG: hypothetical protein C9356_12970 [Oleiphilus sp.]|nr:MAG: hypothetical protein C9356_12970 [Oleiphilus sp.]
MKMLCYLVLLGLPCGGSYAQVWIQEVQSLSFPKALPSESGKKRIIVTHNGNLGGGTNATIVGTYYNEAEFIISSDSTNTITVDIQSNEDIAGVTLKGFKLRYEGVTYKSFPASGLPSPGSGTSAKLGMKVVYQRSVGEGEMHPSFVINVTEDL